MNKDKLIHRIVSYLKKEPLVKFFIVSICIYLAYSFFGKENSELLIEKDTIYIELNEIVNLENSFKLLYYRLPNAVEKEKMVNKYVRELVLYAEALKMGLDNDDVVIKRRVVLKFERIIKESIIPEQPNKQTLQTYFEKYKDDYKNENLYTFTQLFFNPDKREETTLDDADEAINKLKTNNVLPSSAGNYGDAIMLKNSYTNLSQAKITRQFGHSFTKSIIVLEPNKWHGPILSGYGVHLVYITKKEIGEIPKLEEVREKVTLDWMKAKIEELNKLFIDNIISIYTIIIEEVPTSNVLTVKEK